MAALLSLTLTLFCSHRVAGSVLFTENFNGGFNQTWLTGAALWPNDGNSYQGAPTGSFTTVDGAQVYRMNTPFNAGQSRGWISQPLPTASFSLLEARVNTLTQNTTYIDGLFQIYFVNASDDTQYVGWSLFGANFSLDRKFFYSSSLDGGGSINFNYTSDTWYRFRLTNTTTSLRVALYDDTGSTELLGHTFTHTLAQLGPNFRIAFGQFLGNVNGYAPLSAVDYIQAQGLIPEPALLSLLLLTTASLLRLRFTQPTPP